MEKVLRHLMRMIYVHEKWIKESTTYSMRRAAPTWASALRMSMEYRQMIGNWQDLPGHAGKETNERAQHFMADHYADDKVGKAAAIKGAMLAGIVRKWELVSNKDTLHQEMIEVELSQLRQLSHPSKDGKRTEWTISDLIADWHTEEWTVGEDITEQTISTLVERTAAAPPDAPPTTEDELPHLAEGSSDSDNLMSEADSDISDESSDGSQEDRDTWSAPSNDLSTQWFIQAGGGRAPKLHFQAAMDFDQYPIPFCKTHSQSMRFDRAPEEKGFRVDQIPPDAKRCKQCVVALPAFDRAALDLYFISKEAPE